ncbi:hypothetical protein HN643_00495 [Candidatus Falkowbacteria bacterium]|mgnify:CR=1 FL=1|jgi:uncharacterized protein YgbK (DUF1537 family)|nr:hypothetical protein [Candidatus Falkowbacteria bacterium]MBT5503334.1 hypothetical protein [Candidatus Falkowbacteria bacterium]MBT6573665.1 hypothetical protein [Candidatus Falkowbacteria bacterium]MBT7500136.1 hypothetical protein [Candidatus Falkowbacteria bacterium]
MTTKTNAPTQESVLPEQEVPQEDVQVQQVVETPTESENTPEQAAEAVAPVQESEAAAVSTVQSAQPTNEDEPSEVKAFKSEDLQQIEKILSEGLDDLYKELPENRKAEFRQKGEETARAVERLLESAKVKIGKVVRLITEWLKMIPGVNKYFLEQESKIKADRLLEYKQDKEEGKI